MIDWNFIKNMEKGTELFSVFPEAIPLGENFYKIGPDVYAETTRGRALNSSFVTFIAWAASQGAARQVFCLDKTADDGAIGNPPEALLLEPGCISYPNIKKIAESGRFGQFRCFEASKNPLYNYTMVGKRLAYCFRSSEGEIPYANYRGLRWELCG